MKVVSQRKLKSAFVAVAAASALLAVMVPAGASADFTLGVDESALSSARYSEQDWADSGLIAKTGSRLIRRFAYWSKIAPTKPADGTNPNDPVYLAGKIPGGRWADTDRVARVAAANNAEVMFSFYSAPAWAEGPGRPTTGYGKTGRAAPRAGSWKPNAVAFGEFAKAVAKRYDGNTPDPIDPSKKLPRVRLFEAWNEPNYQMFLTPQCSQGRMLAGSLCSSNGTLVAPSHYVGMLNSFYDGIKSVQPDASVAAGVFGPYGNSSQGFEIDPQIFARRILCLGGTSKSPIALSPRCPVKAKLDALSFHPYTLYGKPTTKAGSPNGGALGNAPDFRKALNLAVTAGTILPAGPKELWETETGWFTCPPCRGATGGTTVGIKADLAARYTAEMIYRAWSWGVQKLIWFGLVDSPGWPGGLNYECAAGAISTGDVCATAKLGDAVAKPGLSAFRFPLFAAKAPKAKAFVWAMSPCKVPGSKVAFELFNSRSKKWSKLMVPGPKTPAGRPTSVQLVLTLGAGTDGTVKSAPWNLPRKTSSIRATASGTGCATETSIAMPIAAK